MSVTWVLNKHCNWIKLYISEKRENYLLVIAKTRLKHERRGHIMQTLKNLHMNCFHYVLCHLVKRERKVGTLQVVVWVPTKHVIQFHTVSAQCSDTCGITEVICPSTGTQHGFDRLVILNLFRYYSNMKTVLWKHTNTILGRTESFRFVIEIPARNCNYVIKEDCFDWLVFCAYRSVTYTIVWQWTWSIIVYLLYSKTWEHHQVDR